MSRRFYLFFGNRSARLIMLVFHIAKTKVKELKKITIFDEAYFFKIEILISTLLKQDKTR
jgi:hypothetical protein